MPESDSPDAKPRPIFGQPETGRIVKPTIPKGAHEFPSRITSLTDQQVEHEFLAGFAPLEPETMPDAQTNLPETYTGKREPNNTPSSITLPIGTVIYDEDGEAYKIEEITEVDGKWIRPSGDKGGPAEFWIEAIYPNGRDAGGKKVNGQFAKRKGKLWYGQTTTSGVKSSDR